jgi:peptidoglycan/xylan/chitin deacetylase (PgdA/CDA1 family)
MLLRINKFYTVLKYVLIFIQTVLEHKLFIKRKKITVFLYHEISDTPTEFSKSYGLCVSNVVFRKQVEWIRKNFTIIHPLDLINSNKIPSNAALITFDDGFRGAYHNGISYLIKNKIPSLMFLNMGCILENTPLESALACYYSTSSLESMFNYFPDQDPSNKNPLHLFITPDMMKRYLTKYGDSEYKNIKIYQGELASFGEINSFIDSDFHLIGNHLYQHWNAEALSDAEFIYMFKKNRKLISDSECIIDFFAFPNGQPDTCFSQRHLSLLKELGVKKIFYSSGGANNDSSELLLNRTAMFESDNTNLKLWKRIVNANRIANKHQYYI